MLVRERRQFSLQAGDRRGVKVIASLGEVIDDPSDPEKVIKAG